MLDVLTWAMQRSAERASATLQRLGVSRACYLLATLHRSENTDDRARLTGILRAFNAIDEPIVVDHYAGGPVVESDEPHAAQHTPSGRVAS